MFFVVTNGKHIKYRFPDSEDSFTVSHFSLRGHLNSTTQCAQNTIVPLSCTKWYKLTIVFYSKFPTNKIRASKIGSTTLQRFKIVCILS